MPFPQHCQCPGPGYCSHVKRAMSDGLHAECKENLRFRLTLAGVPATEWPPEAISPPGILQQVGSFVVSGVKHVLAGMPQPSPEEIDRRRSICQSCEHWNGSRCGLCKCFTKAKTAWLLEKCPAGKWELQLVAPSPSDDDSYSALRSLMPTGIPTTKDLSVALKDVCAKTTGPPVGLSGRGIVIAAGGWRFLCGVFVTVKMLRWLGCDYPVEVWYNGDVGEFDPCFAGITAGLDVTWRDASAELRRLGITRRLPLMGWPLKPLAYLLSSFEEVLGLDADCYPVLDPRTLFDDPRYKARGAVLWPDRGKQKHGAPLHPDQWRKFGLEPRTTPGIESGQVLIDKRRHWHSLAVCTWLNDHYDYCYQPGPAGLYGDKDTFAVGFHAADEWGGNKSGNPYAIAPATRWLHVAFMQHDLTGRVMFVHRCADKPRLQRFDYGTKQFGGSVMVRSDRVGGKDPEIAHEWKVFELVEEFKNLLTPASIQHRPGTADESIWREVVLLNAYRLPERFNPGDVVVDVGAHIGIVSRTAALRGATVYALEPYNPNRELLEKNVAGLNVTIDRRGVWSESGRRMGITDCTGVNTGSPHLIEGDTVETVSLDEILRKFDRIELLKLDCEGCEKEAVLNSTELYRVRSVAIEWHGESPVRIGSVLAFQGFEIEWEETSAGIGLLWASRG